MHINNTQAYNIGSNHKKNISHKGAREIVRCLADPNDKIPTVLLETTVTGGRGYNAYKRGGVNELRERAFDDIISAIFWIQGVDICNSIADKLVGKHILKLSTTEFDVGKDALRTPLENLKEKVSNPKLYTNYKYAKVIMSTLLSTAFVGFALPRINQTITKIFMGKDAAKKVKEDNIEQPKQNSHKYGYSAFETFEAKITKNENKNQNISFKALNIRIKDLNMRTIVHALENNKICKLVSGDVGITTGRVASARNKDEGIEYLFRDVTSSFFYNFSTPLIYAVLQKLTKSKATTEIDPVTARQVTDHISEQLKACGGNISVQDFTQKILGSLDESANEILKQLNFKDDVISLKALKEVITDENIIEKATQMAKLQPKQATVGAVLTKQQVEDVLKNGSMNTAEFMMKIYKEKFGDKLTDAYKYIQMKDITSFRDNIENYAQVIIKSANKSQNGVITEDLIKNVSKKSLAMSALFRVVAMGTSAIALGIVIPKLQYALTAKRTGSNAAPGLREYEQTEAKKA